MVSHNISAYFPLATYSCKRVKNADFNLEKRSCAQLKNWSTIRKRMNTGSGN